MPEWDNDSYRPGHITLSRTSVPSDRKIGLVTSSGPYSEALRTVIRTFMDHFDRLSLTDLGISQQKLTAKDAMDLAGQAFQQEYLPVIVGFFPDFADGGYLQADNTVAVINNVPDTTISHSTGYIGYQRHLVSHTVVQEIESLNFSCMSLGKLRSQPNIVEPVMRSTETLYANLNSLRKADAPGISGCLPSGLNSEEFCQLMKYAGSSSQLRAVIIDLNDGSTPGETEATLLAEGIWYLMEGLNMFFNDHPSESGQLSSIIVHHPHYDDDIEFVRNDKTSRWWVVRRDDIDQRTYLACASEEYQQSVNGEMPDRLLKFLSHE